MHEKVVIKDSIKFTANLTLKSRTYYSIYHIKSAAHFSKLSADVEKAFDGKYSDELYCKQMAYVTGAVFASVSFLEATINELFVDAHDKIPTVVNQLHPEAISQLSEMWKLGVPKLEMLKLGVPKASKILQKFQTALTLNKKPLFDAGKQPYKDIECLIKLRNALVHYEPEWITNSSDTEEITIQKLENILKGKFQLNPLAGMGNSFFPDKCLGHGCAEWTVRSSIMFTDEFFLRMGLKPTYDHVRVCLA